MAARKSPATLPKSTMVAPGSASGSGFTGATRRNQGYGWTPDLPDQRDLTYAVPAAVMASIPSNVDLRASCPPIYDQGQLGSCTGNAIAAALAFDQMKQGQTNVPTPSRLFIYYNERVMEGTVASDAGAQIRDGIKSVAQQGDCPETLWPYVIKKFAVKPSKASYANAANHKAINYQSVSQNIADMKGCLASGYPIVVGFTVYESFETTQTATTGVIPLPNPSSEKVLGGHCVLVVGYNDSSHVFICRNSWGTGWGQAGYFTMPFSYLIDNNLASDFWTIRVVQ